ncbi:hypothetical protein ABIB57_000486 [Devosia sp. UYZn731]|uniref:hypothetical protein n=1 Tax=Devosia sp. UYZn731 TaxID=3156345 RepID=UPI0033907BBB
MDLTLHAALGTTLGGDSGLSVHTTGFGTMTATASNTVWGEFGAHAAWAITENATLDLYATTIAGPDIGTNAHVGAGYRYKF